MKMQKFNIHSIKSILKLSNKIILAFMAVLLIQACSQNDICTSEFAMFYVQVLDPAGEPAEGVNIQITGKQSGEIYPCDEYLCEEIPYGLYIIMHDGLHGQISNSGEAFVVEGTKDGLSFRQEFVFRSGNCHVKKISGPETVTLTEV